MHEELSQLPLKSGKPTYIDKTFAPDYPTAKRIFDLAEANGTPCYSTSALRYACLLYTSWNGAPVALTNREFELLRTLMRNRGIVMTREKLLEQVWGYDYAGETNVVDVYIRYLRQKIDDAFGVKLIHTVRGVGYAFRDAEGR